MHKLVPVIALTYVQKTVGHFCTHAFSKMQLEVEKKDYSSMDVLHHLLAGFKAILSEKSLLAVEICRKSCGGAGYASLSGLPAQFSASSPIPTFEGDNTVMLLQAARYVTKLQKIALQGKKVPFPFGYFNR
jgi:hypothetical protein